jgi:pimeloyl-ACP methyl ester carboxylesterase
MKLRLLAVASTIVATTFFTGGEASSLSDCPGTPVGTPITVPGFEDRPTTLQISDLNAPLVVMMHGMNGCIAAFQSQSSLDTVGPLHGINVLWVSGTKLSASAKRIWVAYREGSAETYEYLAKAVLVARYYGITSNTVIAAGISMGGSMALAATCKMPDVFMGAVSVVGASNIPCYRIDRSLLVVGGTADTAQGTDMPIKVAERWVQESLECPNPPVDSSISILNSLTWTCDPTPGTPQDSTITRMVLITHMGHMWPLFYFYNADLAIISFAYKVNQMHTWCPNKI